MSYEAIQAWSAAIQTLLVVIGVVFGVYQILRAEWFGRVEDAQAAYREYLATALEYATFAVGDCGQDPISEIKYARFVTFALAACDKYATHQASGDEHGNR